MTKTAHIALTFLTALLLPFAAHAQENPGELDGARIELPLSTLERVLIPESEGLALHHPTSARLIAELHRDHIRIRGKLDYDATATTRSYALIKVADSSLVPLSVTRDGAPVALLQHDGATMASLQRGGVVTLEIDLIARTSASRDFSGPVDAQLLLPPAVVTTVELAPMVNIQGFTTPLPAFGESPKTIGVPLGEKLAMRYIVTDTDAEASPEDLGEEPDAETRLLVQQHNLLTVGEGRLNLDTRLELEIRGQGVDHVVLTLPVGFDLVQCKGPEVKRCTRQEDGNTRVDFNYALKNNELIEITLDAAIEADDTRLPYPQIKVAGAESDRGFLAVDIKAGTEVSSTTRGEMRTIDPSELPSTLEAASERPVLLAFRYVQQPATVELHVIQHESEPVLAATIDLADLLTLITVDGKAVTRATWSIRNNGKQFLRVEVPRGATLFGAFLDGEPTKPRRDGDDILIPLKKSVREGNALNTIRCEVVYLWRLDDPSQLSRSGTIDLDLPSVDVPASQLQVQLYLPEANRYTITSPAFTDLTGNGGQATRWDVYERRGEEQLSQSLPVDFSIPETGVLKRTTRTLILAGEQSTLQIEVIPQTLIYALEALLLLLSIIFGVAGGIASIRGVMRQRTSISLALGATSAASLAGLVALPTLWPLSAWPFVLGIFLAFVLLGVYLTVVIVRYFIQKSARQAGATE